jgi:uncharacterized membrane protein YwzB
MIQRKQSIWLLIAAILTFLCFFLPFGINQQSYAGSEVITEINLYAKSDIVLTIIASVASLLSLLNIFLYKNRSMQMKLTLLAILLNLGLVVYSFVIASQADKGNKFIIGILGSQLYIGILLPVLSIILLGMAYNGINSDDKLVKSTDRLR